MAAIEFQGWPKIPRLNRDMVITEKIDGSNAAIHIRKHEPHTSMGIATNMVVHPTGEEYLVVAQSRHRLIFPGKATDNMGFAGWVADHAIALVKTLGEGLHFGEWWGSGINRGYGLTKGEKRFSLFNVNRYEGISEPWMGLGVVPVLYEGPFCTDQVENTVASLARFGSQAAPEFMNPEGVVVFHEAARWAFKVTIKNDEKPKGQA